MPQRFLTRHYIHLLLIAHLQCRMRILVWLSYHELLKTFLLGSQECRSSFNALLKMAINPYNLYTLLGQLSILIEHHILLLLLLGLETMSIRLGDFIMGVLDRPLFLLLDNVILAPFWVINLDQHPRILSRDLQTFLPLSIDLLYRLAVLWERLLV